MDDHPKVDEEEVNELKVFVGNLPFTATSSEIEDIFSKIGQVVGVNLREDRDTNRPKGFGFVTFACAESATEAIALLDGYIMEGRTLTVSSAVKRGVRVNAEKEKEDQEWMTVPTRKGGGKSGSKNRANKKGKQKSWTSWAVPPGNDAQLR